MIGKAALRFPYPSKAVSIPVTKYGSRLSVNIFKKQVNVFFLWMPDRIRWRRCFILQGRVYEWYSRNEMLVTSRFSCNCTFDHSKTTNLYEQHGWVRDSRLTVKLIIVNSCYFRLHQIMSRKEKHAPSKCKKAGLYSSYSDINYHSSKISRSFLY